MGDDMAAVGERPPSMARMLLDRVRALIAGSLEETNRRLPRWETVKRFAVLRRTLTVEDGDLTPNLKLKRRAVTAKHHDLLDALYEGGSAATAPTPQPPPPPERTSSRGHDGPLDRG